MAPQCDGHLDSLSNNPRWSLHVISVLPTPQKSSTRNIIAAGHAHSVSSVSPSDQVAKPSVAGSGPCGLLRLEIIPFKCSTIDLKMTWAAWALSLPLARDIERTEMASTLHVSRDEGEAKISGTTVEPRQRDDAGVALGRGSFGSAVRNLQSLEVNSPFDIEDSTSSEGWMSLCLGSQCLTEHTISLSPGSLGKTSSWPTVVKHPTLTGRSTPRCPDGVWMAFARNPDGALDIKL